MLGFFTALTMTYFSFPHYPFGSFMKIVVGILFVIILASLASAFLFLMKDKSQTNRTVKALTVRIGLSVGLFLLILFSWYMGWIETTGIR